MTAEPDSMSVESHRSRFGELWPGIALCLAAAAVSFGLSLLVHGASALIIAIILGLLVANVMRLPDVFWPGIDFSAKRFLRAGIVFLGLQIVLSEILHLGVPMMIVVVCIVAGGLLGTVLLGRLLGIHSGLTLLIACGFSICGAAAVAGVAGVTDPEDEAEEDTITAVALVVIFGTLMIPLVPLVAKLLDMSSRMAGLWAGGSIQEIAQVVAAGGILGSGALATAVIVKLARVLLLAPVVAVISIRQRRLSATADGDSQTQAKRPPIVPLFIVGFIAMMLVRSFIPLPHAALTLGLVLQTGLLSAAMFGLGCGVNIRSLIAVGIRPFVLATLSTVLVATIAYFGTVIALAA